MSFLTERSLRSALPVARRALAVRQTALPRRAFSTSLRLRKSPADSVKDGLKTVDRAVTDNVVLPGLEAAGMLFPPNPQRTTTHTHVRSPCPAC